MKRNQIGSGETWFTVFNTLFLLFISAIMLYPFIYTFSISISDPFAVIKGQVKLFPVGFSSAAYMKVASSSMFYRSYLNTFIYSVTATLVSVSLTMLTAYPLAVKSLRYRHVIVMYFTITMFFGGGLIPSYLMIKYLGMLNKIWAIIIPGALGMWSVIICRTFIQGISENLRESAFIDGASEWRILLQIIVPLSKPIIAVMSLYTVVGQWNNYFGPMLYLTDSNKFPLQLVLRRLLVDDTLKNFYSADTLNRQSTEEVVSQSIRCAAIILTIAPIVCIYPFLQKYFAKGVMLGSIKG